MTDSGNYILDCAFGRIDDPEALDEALKLVPGVVENGLFLGIADVAIIAGPDGVAVIERDMPPTKSRARAIAAREQPDLRRISADVAIARRCSLARVPLLGARSLLSSLPAAARRRPMPPASRPPRR